LALRLVNTAPGDFVESFLPGTPVALSVKSETQFVRLASLKARLAVSNLVHKSVNGVAVFPEAHTDLLRYATVARETPERRRPIAAVPEVTAAGTSLLIGEGSGGVDQGLYEISTETKTYSDVLASVSFKVSQAWTTGLRYWNNLSDIAPLYAGFEYGIRNTGLFVALRASGNGTLVVGGPLHAFSSARPLQAEYDIDWLSWADGSECTLYFDVETATQSMNLWLMGPAHDAPMLVDSFLLGQLGPFEPDTSAFPQRRSGPSHALTLYFGNGGGVGDVVEITNYALYRQANWGIKSGEVGLGHGLRRRPDLPVVFRASDRILPTAKSLGMWRVGGTAPPAVSSWFQPGRRLTPLYSVLAKPANVGLASSTIFRSEPCLESAASGFSLEAWMSGNVTGLTSVDTGVGLMVQDGTSAFVLTALDTQLQRTWGLLLDPGAVGEIGAYAYPQNAGVVVESEYRGLRLVRLTGDRQNDKLRVFVEDMDTPLLSIPLSQVTVPARNAGGRFEVGHVGAVVADGEVDVAAISYLNRYSAWESLDAVDPESVGFTFEATGSNGFSFSEVATISKEDFGTGADKYAFFVKEDRFTLLRGAQVDFRAQVVSYTDVDGTSGQASQWTGCGVTIYFGQEESPLNDFFKLTVGFFDCGLHGRKIAIVPGAGSVADIINQTPLGRRHSADCDWLAMGSYRIVYQPYYKIEVYGPGLLKTDPLISIPWADFTPEQDVDQRLPSIAFGSFEKEFAGTSKWAHLRWGVSSGYEIELTQQLQDVETLLGGRADLYVDVDEIEYGGV